MSEPIWTNVRVKLPADFIRPGVDPTMDDDSWLSSWPKGLDGLTELLEVRAAIVAIMEAGACDLTYDNEPTDGVWEVSLEGEMNYGLAALDSSYATEAPPENPLTVLERHGIPFRAVDFPKYEFDGTLVEYAGTGDAYHGTSDTNGNAFVTRSEVEGRIASGPADTELLLTWILAAVGLDESGTRLVDYDSARPAARIMVLASLTARPSVV